MDGIPGCSAGPRRGLSGAAAEVRRGGPEKANSYPFPQQLGDLDRPEVPAFGEITYTPPGPEA